VLADTALEKGLFDKAEALYQQLVEVGERRQFHIPLALVYLGLAYIHLISGRESSGVELADHALRLIEPSGAFQLFIDQGERCRVVCNALIQAGHQTLFVERVLENLPGRQRSVVINLSDPSAIVVRCLGSFSVQLGGQELNQERWVSVKARDLLAYFVTFRGERIPAEKAHEAIWSEKPGRSLTAFHTALSRLRNALRSQDPTPRYILTDAGDYHLDAARFNIDIDDFDAALANARATSDDEVAARWLEHATDLYQGEYLQNLYYDWLFPERRRISQEYLGMLRQLADYHFAHDRFTRSLDLLHRALRLDNLLEDLHCQAMRVYAALGDRAGLMRQYQEMNDVLKDEMSIEPLASTQRLYHRLLSGIED
jgi:two-component SAPR family response regulator